MYFRFVVYLGLICGHERLFNTSLRAGFCFGVYGLSHFKALRSLGRLNTEGKREEK